MTLTPAFLDELRARTGLTSLIQRKVKLTKAGNEMKGCCPFHGEKTPSFYVNDDKGFYHCFGCSAHGDAIRWLTDHEGLPFMDAVKQLAAAAGMEMPAASPRDSERDREHDELLDVMRRAAEWFAERLMDTDKAASDARAYLAERGISPATAKRFGIGWAPASREPLLRQHLRDVGNERMVALGLLKVPEDRDPYDFFRGRVMFPVRDSRGRPIGFGGRAMGQGQPKYLNTPAGPTFDKGATLYNLDLAAPAARAAKRLLVVEGYMDVIGLAGAGVGEVVAPNGTALTEQQIARLWRIANTPVLCFDGDKAGKAAASRAAIRALPLLEPDRSLSFVSPPDGQDPDDVARGGGAAAVEAMLAAARPLVDVLWQGEIASAPVTTPEQIAGLKTRLRAHIASIKNRDVRDAYGREIAARWAARFDQAASAAGPRRAPLQSAVVRSDRTTERQPFSRREKPQTGVSREVGKGSMQVNVERAVMAGLLNYPQVVASEEALMARFTHPDLLTLREWMVAHPVDDNSPDMQQIALWAMQSPLRFSFTAPDGGAAARDALLEALAALRR